MQKYKLYLNLGRSEERRFANFFFAKNSKFTFCQKDSGKMISKVRSWEFVKAHTASVSVDMKGNGKSSDQKTSCFNIFSYCADC